MEKKQVSIPKPLTPAKPSKPEIILTKLGVGALKAKLISKRSEAEDEPVATSYLNTPVWDNLTFEPGSYTKDGETFDYEGLTINAVLLNVTISKNIIKTAIQGRDGTVKEYISMGDYEIDITGQLISETANQAPISDFNKLIKLCQVPDAIKVTSSFLKLFGIYYIVIDPQASFPQSEGKRNVQYFRISALSDEPIELQKNA